MRYRNQDLNAVDELRRYGQLFARANSGSVQGINYASDHVDGAQPWKSATEAMVRSVAPDAEDRALAEHVVARLDRLCAQFPESGHVSVWVLLFAIAGRGEEWCDTRRADLAAEVAFAINGPEWRAFWLGVLPQRWGRAIAVRCGEWIVGTALHDYASV